MKTKREVCTRGFPFSRTGIYDVTKTEVHTISALIFLFCSATVVWGNRSQNAYRIHCHPQSFNGKSRGNRRKESLSKTTPKVVTSWTCLKDMPCKKQILTYESIFLLTECLCVCDVSLPWKIHNSKTMHKNPLVLFRLASRPHYERKSDQ